MAVYKQKGSKNWWFKFTWHGELIRESTKQTNKRVAEQMEAARKTQLAKNEVGLRDKTAVPTLATFAEQRFLPHIRAEKAGKPRTVAFYETCSTNLTSHSGFKNLPLDRIKAEHITAFVESRRAAGMETSTINRDLATLRRMLNLAEEWETIEAARSIKLLPGEKRRERVISQSEESKYLNPAPLLLAHLAVIMLDCGLRPEECHRLRWRDNIRDNAIEVHTGKGSGSRRRIEVTDRVGEILAALPSRNTSEFVFPAPTETGHIDASSYKGQHEKALRRSGISPFVPYSLRHTCLTRWAMAGMDPFTLQYLAGHKNIATTMRYIHLARTDAQEKLREIRQRMKEKAEAQGGHSFGHSGELKPLERLAG